MRIRGAGLLAAAAVFLPLGITTSVALADTPVTSPRLTELESEMMVTRSEIEELGGSPSPTTAINNAQTEVNELDATIERMEGIATELGATAEDLAALREEYGETGVVRLSDVPEEVVEEGAMQCIKRGCARLGAKVAARLTGWISLAGDVVSYGGRLVIRELNEARIREMVRDQYLKRSDIYDLLSALRCQRQERRAAVTRLRELRDRERSLASQIAEERQRAVERQRQADRAGRASRHANQQRDTDYPGDLEEWRKHEENPPTRRLDVRPADHSTQGAMNLSPFARDVLAAHNQERSRYGYPALNWNPALESTATAYAQQLASSGQRTHASRVGRGDERENINQGMIHWTTSQMLHNWFEEKARFTPGTFPNVCAGDWSKCGHYTQIIWPTTTDIGCGTATGEGFKWLVCRYAPGGNKDGKPVGHTMRQPAIIASRKC